MNVKKDAIPLSAAILVHASFVLYLGFQYQPLPTMASGLLPSPPVAMSLSPADDVPEKAPPESAFDSDPTRHSAFEIESTALFLPEVQWVPEPIAAPDRMPPPGTLPSRETKSSVAQHASESRGRTGKTGEGSPAHSVGSSVRGGRAQQPALLRSPLPPYPADALRNKWTGVVLLEVHVSDSGLVASVKLLRSSGYEALDQAAMAGMKDWRFSPARSADGSALGATVEIPVRFKLGA